MNLFQRAMTILVPFFSLKISLAVDKKMWGLTPPLVPPSPRALTQRWVHEEGPDVKTLWRKHTEFSDNVLAGVR